MIFLQLHNYNFLNIIYNLYLLEILAIKITRGATILTPLVLT
jgi:hypothetical protein